MKKDINFNENTKSQDTKLTTYFERLSSRDDATIVAAAQELVLNADNYFEQRILPNLLTCAAVKEGAVPKNFPLPLRFNFPFLKKYLKAMYPVILQTKMQNKLFFGNIQLTNTDYKTPEYVKAIETVLEKHLYEFNNPNEYFTENDMNVIDFGYSAIKQVWKKEKTKIDDIELYEDEELPSKNNTKKDTNNEEKQSFNYTAKTKINEKLIADNLDIECVDIHNFRIDPLAKKPRQMRFCYEYIYPDYDQCIELFKDFKNQTDFKKDSYESEATDANQHSSYRFNMMQPSNQYDSQQEIQNPRIIEFWDKWGHRFYFLCSSESNKILKLLKLKNLSTEFSYLNPYSHKKIPYTLFYYQKNKKDCYGIGLINEIIPLYVMMIYLLSLSIIEEIKRVMTPIGIRNTGQINLDEVVAALEGNGRYFTVQGEGDIKQFIYQIQQNSAGSLFQLQQYFEGMIQAQTRITDYQLGGNVQQQYNKTLGGIQAIFEESVRQLSFLNITNIQSYKRLVKIALSTIIQKQSEPITFAMLGENSTEYIKIKTEFDTPINNPKDVISYRENAITKEIILSDLLKFELNFDILFEYGGDTYTLARYNEALRLAGILIPAGIKINLKRIATKYFERIGMSDAIIDDNLEMKKIIRENEFMALIAKEYQQLVKAGTIQDTPENYIDYMSKHIPEPDPDNDNHQLHYDNQPDGIHRQMHAYFVEKEKKQAEQMQAALQAEQAQQMQAQGATVDGRTRIQNEQPMQPQPQPQPQGQMI